MRVRGNHRLPETFLYGVSGEDGFHAIAKAVCSRIPSYSLRNIAGGYRLVIDEHDNILSISIRDACQKRKKNTGRR
jgi:hypothetical protein